MIMCVLLCYPVSIRTYYQQGVLFLVTTGLSGPAVHVLDRSSNSHRKAGSPQPTTHETHTVASQKQLEGTRISGEGYPSTKVPAPSLTMVLVLILKSPGS